MRRALYRVGQFGRLLTRRLNREQLTQIESWLPPPLFELFCRLTPSEQYHAYRVRQTLAAGGHTDPDLLTAALLHDVGKSKMPLAIWERVLIVVGFKFAPSRTYQWGLAAGGYSALPDLTETSHREDAKDAKFLRNPLRSSRLRGSIEVARSSLSSWARPFVVAVHHPEWGAEMVKAAGGTELAVELIRRHQEREEREKERELLLALQEADSNN